MRYVKLFALILILQFAGCTRTTTPEVHPAAVVTEKVENIDLTIDRSKPIDEQIKQLNTKLGLLKGKIGDLRGQLDAAREVQEQEQLDAQRQKLLIYAISSMVAAAVCFGLAFVFTLVAKWLIAGGITLATLAIMSYAMRAVLLYTLWLSIGVGVLILGVLIIVALKYRKLLLASWKDNVNEVVDMPSHLQTELVKVLPWKK